MIATKTVPVATPGRPARPMPAAREGPVGLAVPVGLGAHRRTGAGPASPGRDGQRHPADLIGARARGRARDPELGAHRQVDAPVSRQGIGGAPRTAGGGAASASAAGPRTGRTRGGPSGPTRPAGARVCGHASRTAPGPAAGDLAPAVNGPAAHGRGGARTTPSAVRGPSGARTRRVAGPAGTPHSMPSEAPVAPARRRGVPARPHGPGAAANRKRVAPRYPRPRLASGRRGARGVTPTAARTGLRVPAVPIAGPGRDPSVALMPGGRATARVPGPSMPAADHASSPARSHASSRARPSPTRSS
jgi:hypothetical protein